jgi:hypothetical protein
MDWKNSRLLRIAVGAAVFGALMTFKDSVSPAWARVLIAALAGGVLGLLLVAGKPRT